VELFSLLHHPRFSSRSVPLQVRRGRSGSGDSDAQAKAEERRAAQEAKRQEAEQRRQEAAEAREAQRREAAERRQQKAVRCLSLCCAEFRGFSACLNCSCLLMNASQV
jgi:hypothetical protein